MSNQTIGSSSHACSARVAPRSFVVVAFGRCSRRPAQALAYTCYQMYLRTPTGLSPETIEFNGIGDMRVRDKARFYTLRPETLESFFILHQLTGDPVYREWGWDIFRAIERHCRVGVGYGSYPDVEVNNSFLNCCARGEQSDCVHNSKKSHCVGRPTMYSMSFNDDHP